jgi:tetratricopeptide (TPR) repeat protein
MFFPKLRKRAKWIFLFLALVFALSFAFLGVGAGGSGIGDYVADLFNRTPGASTGPSVSSAKQRAEQNPNDAEAQLAYANSLQADGQTQAAITQLETYLDLRKDDQDALQQLATLYLTLATEAENRAQQAQSAAAVAFFRNELYGGQGDMTKTLGTGGPFTEQEQNAASSAYQAAAASMQANYAKEAETWKRLTELADDNPEFFLQLGRSSQSANEFQQAIDGYERYLELAPNDANADQVEQIVKQLKQQVKLTGGLGSPGGE